MDEDESSDFEGTPYESYVKTFGKITSGTVLSDSDYRQPGLYREWSL